MKAASQVSLPYDVSTQITKEYPPPIAPRLPAKQQAQVIDEPEVHIEWASTDMDQAMERAYDEMTNVPEGEPSQKLASGSGPSTPIDGNPLIQPDRKRAQSRPSMKAVLAGEIDTENELDVPTFIRRHNTTHG